MLLWLFIFALKVSSRQVWLLLAILSTVCKAAPVKEPIHLRKSVQVKSKPHRVSHIDHFNPAGHIYAAHGEIDIIRNRDAEIPSLDGLSSVQNLHSAPVKKITSQIISNKSQLSSVKSNPIVPETIFHKTVSINQPTNIISSINHFNPDGHEFIATGEAHASRQPINRKQAPALTVTKESHHVFPAIQSVVKQSETFTSSQKKQSFVSKPTFSTKNIGSGLSLERTVSVKSPQRISSVISHFTPADHQYAATGNVKINRQSVVNQGPQLTVVKHTSSNLNSKPSNVIVVKKEPFKVPSQQQLTVSKASSSLSSGSRFIPRKKVHSSVNLEKTVSVKSPQRISSVINHFTPADHQYAATGNVKINRQSVVNNGPQLTVLKHTSSNFVSKPSNVIVVKKESFKVPNQQQLIVSKTPSSLISGSSFIPGKKIQSSINLEKTVSVKSPQIVSSVIDHFTPAGHQYAATGNVKINRHSFIDQQPTNVIITKSVPKFVVPKVKKVTVIKNAESFSIPEKVSTFSIDSQSSSFGTDSSVGIIRGPSSFSTHDIGSGINIEKSVSVKSPERISTVIDHFTPAGHRYTATGNVKIHRQSIPIQKKKIVNEIIQEQTFIVPKKQSFFVPEKKVIRVTKQSLSSNKPSKHQVVSEPSSLSSQSSSFSTKNIALGHSLEKTVSVKSPERISSVIAHFTPAQHQYAATGNVKIHRFSSTKENTPTIAVSTQNQLFPQVPIITGVKGVAVKKIFKKEIATKQNKIITVPEAPKVKIVKITEVISDSNRKDPQIPKLKVSSSLSDSSFSTKKIASGIDIEKTVSVKSPERDFSVINHFTPAGHIYAATGNVKIIRQPFVNSVPKVTVIKSGQSFIVPESPVVRVKKTKIVTVPAKEKAVISKVTSVSHETGSFSKKKDDSGFSIEKTVSVKSPNRISSVIDHFTPAGHHYAATGSVKITKHPSNKKPEQTFVKHVSVLETNKFEGPVETPIVSSSSGFDFSSSNKNKQQISSTDYEFEPIVYINHEKEETTGDANHEETIINEKDSEDKEESSVFIKIDSETFSEEDKDDSDSNSDESDEFFGSQFFGAVQNNDDGYLPPVNDFYSGYLPPSNAYLPPANDYLPPIINYSTDFLPPIS